MKKRNGQIEILVAEDSPTQAEQLRYLLEENGYQVTTAVNGKVALARVGERVPTLVISDVVMPELDGYGLCRAIKSDERWKHLPVILVTTLSDPEDVIRGLECGADNFIRKPYEEKYLLSRIEYLLMNIELRKNQRMHMAMEIAIGGRKHTITAERQQMLDLLVSTYEQAVHVNAELKQRDKELAHSNQVLRGLNHIAEGLNCAVSEHQVAVTALERALALPGIQAGWIFLRTGETGFRLAAARGLTPAQCAPDYFESDCACRRQLLSGELGAVTNIQSCERLSRDRSDARGLCCHATVPLWLGEGRALGVMNLAGTSQGLFDEAALAVLNSVGNQVAVALERARLHENLERLVAERTAKLVAEIEERKRIEAEQARLVSIIEATPDLVGSADPDGRPIFLNSAGMRMLGLTHGRDAIPARIADTHPEWAAKIVLEEALPHAMAHGVWHGELAVAHADGTDIPVSAVIVAQRKPDGSVGCFSTIMRDISQRVRAERAMRQALATLDATEDAAFIFDPDTLRFSYANEGAVRQVGYSRDQLLTMTPLDIHPDLDEAGFRALLVRTMRGEAHGHRCTCLHRHRDGRDIPVEENMQYVAPEGEPPRFIVIARDVTERQAYLSRLEQAAQDLSAVNAALADERNSLAERVARRTVELTVANDELARAKVAAEEASRAKSAFLATMSHEIRTPMNGVIGMVDVLAQTALSEHQADLTRTVRDSANSLLTIIDDILDFSKIEAGRLELEQVPVAIADLVEGLCGSLVPVAARKGVELSVFVAPTIPDHVLSDDVRLRQVLYNLVGNAIKFSAGRPNTQGRVSVRAEIGGLAPLRLVFKVFDNGIGMAPETVDNLFTPFTQAEVSTTRRFGGTGLGLAICKRLVDLMGGEIDITSAEGSGSCFTVSIPFSVPDEQPERNLPDLSGLDCMVADSASYSAADLCAYVEHAGARGRVAPDAATALRFAGRLSGSAVVILDGHCAAPSTMDAFGDAVVTGIRRVLIARGVGLRARQESAGTVSLDGDALRRAAFLRAVAVAAGRASPEVFHNPAELASMAEVAAPTVKEARAKGQLILVAEDDEINRKVIQQQLALLGYAAEFADNGVVALRMWREGGYGLLLTDLHMPEMDGYTLAEILRREETERPRKPILALTANALRGEAGRAQAAGIDDYLTKPVQLKLLGKTMEKWLPRPRDMADPAPTPDRLGSGGDLVDFDVRVLMHLIGDSPEVVREFLIRYLESTREHTAAIRAALAAGDVRQIGFLGHRLKSTSRAVGAMAVGKLCDELERLGNDGSPTPITECVARFETALARADTAINGYLAE